MKLSKETVDRMLRCDVKVILPKLPQKPPPFKRKKTKPERNSDCSDKENDNSTNGILRSRANLSSIPVEKVYNRNLRGRFSKRLNLSEDDHKLLLATLNNKRESTKCSRVDSVKTKNTANRVSRSQSINGPRVYGAVARSRNNYNYVETDEKTKQNKCSRKDSGIEMESPRRNKSVKRKFSELSNDIPDDIPELNNINDEVPVTNSPGEIRQLIQSYSSHKCTDKSDRKMYNVKTWQNPGGTFVRKDFVIRIQQCCFNRPSKNSTPGCITSVVANTTKCENIEKNALKTCKNISLEKVIGVSTRVKVGNEDKTCSRIVQSKYVQTENQKHKKPRLTEPSRMVTRRKAASNLELEFFKLTNEKKIGVLVDPIVPKIRNDRSNQNKKNNADKKKKMNSLKNKVSEEEKRSEIRSQTNNEEPVPSSGQFNSSSEGTVENSNQSAVNAMNLKNIAVSKILKDVSLYREEVLKPSTSRVIQKPTICSDENISKVTTKPKKTDLKQEKSKSLDDSKLRKSSRVSKPRVLLSFGSESDSTSSYSSSPTPAKRVMNGSRTRSVGVSIQNVKKQDLQSSAKPQNPTKIEKINRVEIQKKSNLPTKKLMKRSEALKKTERFNKQKNFKNGDETAQSKAISPKDSALPKSIRFSSKTRSNSSEASNSETEVNGETSCVQFSSKTPNTIPLPKNEGLNNCNYDCSPYILLDKLDVKDISNYAITPLREDRRPQPSKSYEDYGIDDVNTDDSTDEEEYPKKVVPQWVKTKDHATKVQFYFPREVITKWIKPPTTRFTIKSLFF